MASTQQATRNEVEIDIVFDAEFSSWKVNEYVGNDLSFTHAIYFEDECKAVSFAQQIQEEYESRNVVAFVTVLRMGADVL